MAQTSHNSPKSPCSVSTSQSISLSDLLAPVDMSEIPDEKPLSVTTRGLTQVVWNKSAKSRVVARISLADVSEGIQLSSKVLARAGSAARSYAFGTYAFEHRDEMIGIVPVLSPPHRADGFLVEVFEEVTLVDETNQRFNLCDFINSPTMRRSSPANQVIQYLFHVSRGVDCMHAHGWAHMDLSLTNVAVTDSEAFIIDFESTLPTQNNFGFIRKRDLRVPMKENFVPPEHHLASDREWVSLEDYDIWAFGIMVFCSVFHHFLFPYSLVEDKRGRSRPVLKTENFEYFVENGFEQYLKKYYRLAYSRLFGRESTRFTLLGDLLSQIFVMPRPVKKAKKAIIWTTRNRIRADQILQHPFWSCALRRQD